MLDKLNKISNDEAGSIIGLFGIIVFLDGLKNQFVGDDSLQIVNNPPVHSISHILLFFQGGTFYVGNGLAPLSGVYYRPLMETAFSLIYTIFGAHPLYFHLLQLVLCIGSAILLYLIFRYSFKPALSLFLSLVFLVHPLNSQVGFALASMQDALMFFFGILALWLLISYKSIRSLTGVAICLFLSLLAKETGVFFAILALAYLFWYNKSRLLPYVYVMIAPIALYLALKINAIGFVGSNPNNAPIDKLSVAQRLLTAPSIILSYIAKFIFPWKLASGYYWVETKFSYSHVLLPLVLDCGVLALTAFLAFQLYKKASKALFHSYLFFVIWTGLGMLVMLQIIPLDMTASDAWFYFPMAGLLGAIGVVISAFGKKIRIDRQVIFFLALIIVAALGIRTTVRGTDWASNTALAYSDVSATKENFNAYSIIAIDKYNKGQFNQALSYADRSIMIFPKGDSYQTVCNVYISRQEYGLAEQACKNALKFPDAQTEKVYTNTALLMYLNDTPSNAEQFTSKALQKYPNDANLWLYLALLQYQKSDNSDAKVSITKAYSLGQNSTIDSAYNAILKNEPLKSK